MTPVPVGDSQAFLPVLALYATKRPSAVPWKTRLPAVASVPPFHGETCSTRQTSFCATGSHASRRPNGTLLGGSALMKVAVFQPRPAIGWPGLLEFIVPCLS